MNDPVCIMSEFDKFRYCKEIIDSLPSEVVGKALKACFAFIAGGDLPGICDTAALSAVMVIMPYIEMGVILKEGDTDG